MYHTINRDLGVRITLLTMTLVCGLLHHEARAWYVARFTPEVGRTGVGEPALTAATSPVLVALLLHEALGAQVGQVVFGVARTLHVHRPTPVVLQVLPRVHARLVPAGTVIYQSESQNGIR